MPPAHRGPLRRQRRRSVAGADRPRPPVPTV